MFIVGQAVGDTSSLISFPLSCSSSQNSIKRHYREDGESRQTWNHNSSREDTLTKIMAWIISVVDLPSRGSTSRLFFLFISKRFSLQNSWRRNEAQRCCYQITEAALCHPLVAVLGWTLRNNQVDAAKDPSNKCTDCCFLVYTLCTVD